MCGRRKRGMAFNPICCCKTSTVKDKDVEEATQHDSEDNPGPIYLKFFQGDCSGKNRGIVMSHWCMSVQDKHAKFTKSCQFATQQSRKLLVTPKST